MLTLRHDRASWRSQLSRVDGFGIVYPSEMRPLALILNIVASTHSTSLFSLYHSVEGRMEM